MLRSPWTTLVGQSVVMMSSVLLPLVSTNYTGTWSAWSTCSQSCGSGLQIRNRTCTVGCNETQQTQACSIRKCHDLTLHLVIVFLVTAVVMAVMLVTIYFIFVRGAPQRAKHRGSNCNTLEHSTCNRLRTNTSNTVGGVGMESVYLQNLRKDSRVSLDASRQTLSSTLGALG